MLIHEIVDYCNTEYCRSDTKHVCYNCNHPSECSGGCKECLKQIHFPNGYPGGKRDYDCKNLINFYVCDYINKYASEMLYLLRKSNKLNRMYEYNILSIGCGAAPDLTAFEEYVSETNPYKKINYFGIDMNQLWRPIHRKIMHYSGRSVNRIQFQYDDATEYLNGHPMHGIDVVVFQYVISHFYNTGHIEQIHGLFESIEKNVIDNKEPGNPVVILINDVNSCNRGRDFFEEMLWFAGNHGGVSQYYFDYRIQNENQRYGEMHPDNKILFDLSECDLDIYKPWEECSSAQMLIEIE